jgi:hypothetical protein
MVEQYYGYVPDVDEEEELDPKQAYLKGLKTPGQGPISAPRKGQEYTMDQRVQDYLKRASQRPQDYRSPAMIDAAMLGGIAGGAAQLGTTFGMTPSSQPFQQAAMEAAQSIPPPSQERMEIDPVVAQYLKSKKPAQFRPSGISESGKNIYYDPSSGTETEGSFARQIQKPERKGRWESTGKVDSEGNLIYYNSETGESKAGPKVQVALEKPVPAKSKSELDIGSQTYLKERQLDLFNQIESDYAKAYEQGLAGPMAGKLSSSKRALGLSVSPEYDRAASNLGKNLANYIKETSGTAASESEVRRLTNLMPRLDVSPERFKIDMQLLRDETMNTINSLRAARGLPPMGAREAPKLPGGDLSPEEERELEELERLKASQGR